jgi:glycosyltransferase involved in cell wall biosynthesis
MKVAFLGPANSVHTIRWVNALVEAGVEILLISQHEFSDQILPQVKRHQLRHSGLLGYFRNAAELRQVLDREKPDLINAHYATGYGTTARFAGFAPYLLSVWGSDVFQFPETSPVHGWHMRGNLRAATRVASTSRAMARQSKIVAPEIGEVAITPFGVDLNQFARRQSAPRTSFRIGTVKALEPVYGIDLALRAFALLLGKMATSDAQMAARLTMRIVGSGPLRNELIGLAEKLGIASRVEFRPHVPHDQVPAELSELDIYFALSRSESFGVAVIEASACELPVIVSDVGGLPEVVKDGVTGFVVPSENPEAAAQAMEKLVLDPGLRQRMGQAGRANVSQSYSWNRNVEKMISVYTDVVEAFKTR